MTISTEVFELVKRNPDSEAIALAKRMPATNVADVCGALSQLFKKGAVVRAKSGRHKWMYRDASEPWPDAYHEFDRHPEAAEAAPPEVSTPPPPPMPAEPPPAALQTMPTASVARRSLPPGAQAQMQATLESLQKFCIDFGRSMGDMILNSAMERVHEGVESVFNNFEERTPRQFDAGKVLDSINSVSAIAHSKPAEPAPATPTETPRKPHVLVIGVSAAQASKLDREFGIYLKMSYWRIDQMNSLRSGSAACQQLRDMLKGAEFVFEMSRVSNDKVQDIAKSAGTKIEWCTGGIPMLRDQLIGVFASV